MIKFKPDTCQIVFREIPDCVSLAIEITNCQGMCRECHSPWLREDIGEELTPVKLFELIDANPGIDCVVFMGEGNDPDALKKLALSIYMKYPGIKIALYSGRTEVEKEYDLYFNYIKVGPYIPERKSLDFETTNQRLYEIEREFGTDFAVKTERHDITYKFWRK